MTNEAVSKSKTNIQSVTIKVKSGKNGLTIKAAVSMVHHPQAISKKF